MLVFDHMSFKCSYVFVIVPTDIITGSTTLRELNVSSNHIGEDGISKITQWLLTNKTLTKLDVSGCKLSVKGTVLYKMY